MSNAGDKDGVKIMGSNERYFRASRGQASVEDIFNSRKDKAYHMKLVGDGYNSLMSLKPVESIETIRGFLVGNEVEPIVVARIPSDIKNTLNASSDNVLLSRYTADKQAKHPEITADSFAWLQDILDRGERLYDKRNHATVIHHREQPYVAVVKATVDGGEVYLQSFRRSDAKNIASLKKRAGGG